MQHNSLLSSEEDSFNKYNLNKSNLSTNIRLARSTTTYLRFKNQALIKEKR